MDIKQLNEELYTLLYEDQKGKDFLQDFCKKDGKILGVKQLTDKIFNLYYSEGMDGFKMSILPHIKAFYEYVDFDKMARDLIKTLKDYENNSVQNNLSSN